MHVSPTESAVFKSMLGQCDILAGRHFAKQLLGERKLRFGLGLAVKKGQQTHQYRDNKQYEESDEANLVCFFLVTQVYMSHSANQKIGFLSHLSHGVSHPERARIHLLPSCPLLRLQSDLFIHERGIHKAS